MTDGFPKRLKAGYRFRFSAHRRSGGMACDSSHYRAGTYAGEPRECLAIATYPFGEARWTPLSGPHAGKLLQFTAEDFGEGAIVDMRRAPQ